VRLLQINTTVNSGSTGRIAEGIGRIAMAQGHESYIAYGRGDRPSQSKLIRIGNDWDIYWHGAYTLITDRHGFASQKATTRLVRQIEQLRPDAIGLHNLHGYYLNIKVLFEFLKQSKIPVLWTLFDCWAFTGHCTYYANINCQKWQTECHRCPKTSYYPASYGLDQSRRNYKDKQQLFQLPEQVNLIVHSKWLQAQVKQSFLRGLPLHHIYNGTDLGVFQPTTLGQDKLVLGVASTWDERKGLKDFIALREKLPNDYKIVLIGLSQRQIQHLPGGIQGVQRTESVQGLAQWYSKASVFLNPTYQDNFPTTNIEALACGTPVITYDTGGSPEAVDAETGRVVEKGNIPGLAAAIRDLSSQDREVLRQRCRKRAEQHFDKEDRYKEYMALYSSIVQNTSRI
jgi:putative colanic acid biosynthesis glycosyltransferase